MPPLKPPICQICADAGWLTSPGPMGQAVKCVCNRIPTPRVDPPVPPVRQPRRVHGGWSES